MTDSKCGMLSCSRSPSQPADAPSITTPLVHQVVGKARRAAAEQPQHPVRVPARVRHVLAAEAGAAVDAAGIDSPARASPAAMLAAQLRRDLFVGVDREHPVAGGQRPARGSSAGRSRASRASAITCAPGGARDRHGVVGAARIDHDHFVGERDGAQAGARCCADLVAGDEDDGQAWHGSGGRAGRQAHGIIAASLLHPDSGQSPVIRIDMAARALARCRYFGGSRRFWVGAAHLPPRRLGDRAAGAGAAEAAARSRLPARQRSQLWMVPAALLLLFAVRGVAGFLADLALARIAQDGLMKLRAAHVRAPARRAPVAVHARERHRLSNTVVFEVQNGVDAAGQLGDRPAQGQPDAGRAAGLPAVPELAADADRVR